MRGRGISLRGQPSVTTSLASETEDAAQPLGSGTSGPSHDGRSAWTSRAMESGPDYCRGRAQLARWRLHIILLHFCSTSRVAWVPQSRLVGCPNPSNKVLVGAIIFQEDASEVFLCSGCFSCAHPLLFSKKTDHTSLTSVWKLVWRSRQEGLLALLLTNL